jgi:WD40 repeat protein
MTADAPSNADLRHDAFICYSRQDVVFARALEQALERYRPPRELGRPARPLDVFRDEQDFTGVEYNESIKRHLRGAAKLIVICSPSSSNSSFVNDEIRWFSEARGARNIVPVLRGGNPTCDSADETAAFPPALCEALAPLPVGPDYRRFDENKDALHRSPFQDAWFGLLANLLDTERAEIEQRDHRRRRRQRHITIGVTTAVIASLLAALVVALLSRSQAIRDRDLAEQRRQQALARRLMTDSLSVADREYDTAILLALEAARLSPGTDSSGHVRDVLNRNTPFRGAVRRHAAAVLAIGVTNGAMFLASVDAQGTVAVADIGASAEQRKLGIGGTAEAAALTHDGTRVAFAVGNDIELWNIAERRRERVLREHTSAVTSLCFSADGALLASGSWDGSAIIWNVGDGRARYPPLEGHSESPNPLSLAKGVHGVAFNSDASTLATTGGDNTAILWNAHTGQRAVGPLSGHATRGDQLFPGVRSVAFSPDNTILATGGDDRQVRLWNAASGEPLGDPLAGHEGAIRALAFIAGGLGLVSGDEFGVIRIWAVRDRRSIKVLQGHATAVTALAALQQNSFVSSAKDGAIIEWDPFADAERLATSFVVAAPEPQPRSVTGTGRRHFPDLVWSVRFSPSGRRLASGADDGTVVAWEVDTRMEIARFVCQPGQVFAVAFSPDESRLACAGLGSDILVRDLSTGDERRLHTGGPAGRLDFSPDGLTLAAGDATGNVRGWNTATGAALFAFQVGGSPILLVAFIDDGRRLLGGNKNGELVIWDIANRASLQNIRLQTSTPDDVILNGDTLAFWNNDAVQLWSVASGRVVGPNDLANENTPHRPFSLALQGSSLAVAVSAQVSVRDVRGGALMWPTLNARASVNDLAFDRDGRRLAVAGASAAVSVWDLDWKAWHAAACRIAGRSLSRDEWRRFIGDEPYRSTCD